MTPESNRAAAQAFRLFLLAVAVRVVIWLVLGTSRPIADDQADYLALRDVILATARFLDQHTGLPTAFRDPGYPVFLAALALVGLGVPPFLWGVQILVSSLTGVLLFLAVRTTAGERPGTLLGGLFLLHLSFATYSFIAYTETLACCLAGGLLLGLAKWRRRPRAREQVVAGALGAALALTRAASLPGGVGAIAASVAGKLRSRRGWILGLVILLLPPLLWVGRNAIMVGVPGLNTCGVFNLDLGNNPETPMAHSYRAPNPVGDVPNGRPDRERAQIAWRRAVEYATAHPGPLVARALLRIPDALESDRMLIGVARRGQFPDRSATYLLVCGALVILVTAVPTILALAAVLSPGPHWLASAGRWMFLGTLLTQMLTIAHPRYMLPAWILLLPGAALMLERLLHGERRARAATVAAAVIVVIVSARQVLLQ